MKNKKFEEALEKVFKELEEIPEEQFKIKMDKHRNGNIARIIRKLVFNHRKPW